MPRHPKKPVKAPKPTPPKPNAADALDEQLRRIPKGVYCRLSGRQQKVVDDFGHRYQIAITGPTVDLFHVIEALHSRVSELARAAKPTLDGDTAALEREKLKQEIINLERKAEISRITISERRHELVPRADVKHRLQWLSEQLRALGARLHRVGGDEAQAALNDFLRSMAEELDGGALET